MNRGYIVISAQLYEKEYSIIADIFKHVKPLKIEIEYWKQGDVIIYGESEFFDKVEEACAIPQYVVVVKENEDKTHSFEFNKI